MFQEVAKVYPVEQVAYALVLHLCLHHIQYAVQGT